MGVFGVLHKRSGVAFKRFIYCSLRYDTCHIPADVHLKHVLDFQHRLEV